MTVWCLCTRTHNIVDSACRGLPCDACFGIFGTTYGPAWSWEARQVVLGGTPNSWLGEEIHPKIVKTEGWKELVQKGGIESDCRGHPGMPRDPFFGPFWVKNAQKSRKGAQMEPKIRKNAIQNSMQKSMPKKYRKLMRNWSKSDAKRHQKWTPQSIFYGKGDFRKTMLLSQ